MAQEAMMPWSQLADLCTANGSLGLRLYAKKLDRYGNYASRDGNPLPGKS
jgi:hypothetical protein